MGQFMENSSSKIFINYVESLKISEKFQFSNFIHFVFQKLSLKWFRKYICGQKYIISTLTAFKYRVNNQYMKELRVDMKMNIISNYICFTFNPIAKITYNFNEIQSEKSLFDRSFVHSYVRYESSRFVYFSYISVHSRNANPRNIEGRFCTKTEPKLQVYRLLLDRRLIYRLRHPYQPNCLSYRKLRFESTSML